MAFTLGIVRAAANTSTGTQTFTTTSLGGQTPTAAIIVVTAATANSTLTANAQFSYGFTDGTNEATLAFNAEDNVATTSASTILYNNRVVSLIQAGTQSTTEGVAAFSAWTTNGITINWTEAPAAKLVTVYLFAGVSAKVDTDVTGAAASAETYSGASFAFDAAVFITGTHSSLNTARNDICASIGYCDGSGNNYAYGKFYEHGAATTDVESILGAEAAYGLYDGGTEWSIEISNIGSSGFDHTLSGTNVSDHFAFLLLGTGTSTKVATFTQNTTNGNLATTGVGFEPQAMLTIDSHMTSLDTRDTGNKGSGWAIGGGTESEEYSAGVTTQDGQGTTVDKSHSDNQFQDVWYHSSFDTYTTLVSFDTDGFTINYLDYNVGGPYSVYLAFGPAEASTASPAKESLTVDGKQPTIVYEATFSAVPEKETLDVNEYAPFASVDVSASPEKESLTVDGKLPTVTSEATVSAAPEKESLTVDGRQITVSYDVTAFPDKESLLVDGRLPVVATESAETASPEKESLTVDGRLASVESEVIASPEKESLTVDGRLAVVLTEAASTASPEKESLTVDGFLAAVAAEVIAFPEKESLTVDGFQVTISSEEVLTASPEKESLTVDGLQAFIRFDVPASPEKEALTVDGRLPVIVPSVDQTVAPSAESLTVDGFLAEISVPATTFVTAVTRVAGNTGTGLQTITTTALEGLTPVGAIFFTNTALTDGTIADHFYTAVGFTDGTTEGCMRADAEDGQTTTDAQRGQFADNSVIRYYAPGTNTVEGIAHFDSWVPNGVVINWDQNNFDANLITVVFFAGTGASAKVDNIAMTSATSTYSSAGFSLEAGMMASVYRKFSTSAHGYYSLGFVDGSGDQRGIGGNIRNNVATAESHQYLSPSTIMPIIHEGGTKLVDGTIANITSAGFDHFCGGAALTADYVTLLVDTPLGTKVGSLTTPTATGSDSVTGVGFQPSLVLLLASNGSVESAVQSDSTAGVIGNIILTEDAQYSIVQANQDNVGTSQCVSLNDDTIRLLQDDGATNSFLGTFTSFDADGWTWNFDTTTGGKIWYYLAFEGAPTTESTVTPDKGSLTVTTYVPFVAYSVLAEPLVEALTIDGLLPNVSLGNTVIPAYEALTIDGFEPDVSAVIPALTNMAITRVACATAGGTQTITATLNGATPKAAIIIGTSNVTDATAADHYMLSYGFTDGTTDACVSAQDRDGVTPSDAGRAAYSDRCIQFTNPGMTGDWGKAVFSAWVANGIQISWSTAPNGPYFLQVIFIAGDTVQAHVGTATTGTQNVFTTYSGATFAFDAGFFATPARTLAGTSATMLAGFGVCDGDLNQFSIGPRSDDAANPSEVYNCIDDDSVLVISNRTAIRQTTTIMEITSTGFVHMTDLTSADDFIFLLIDYARRVEVGVFDSPTSTGDYSVTGVGFNPELVIQTLTLAEVYGTVVDNGSAGGYGWGIATKNDDFSIAVSTEDAVAPADTKSVTDNALLLLEHDGTTAFAASHQSMDNDGWTYNFTTVNGTAKKWGYIAFEGEAAVAATKKRSLTVTGYAANVSDGSLFNVSVEGEALTEAGYAPNVFAKSEPDTELLNVDGFQPDISPRVYGGVALGITGYAPSLGIPKQEPARDSLVVRGYPPNWPGYPIETQEGTIGVNTYAPTIISTSQERGYFWRRLPDTYTS